jgi:hypothetical protein
MGRYRCLLRKTVRMAVMLHAMLSLLPWDKSTSRNISIFTEHYTYDLKRMGRYGNCFRDTLIKVRLKTLINKRNESFATYFDEIGRSVTP